MIGTCSKCDRAERRAARYENKMIDDAEREAKKAKKKCRCCKEKRAMRNDELCKKCRKWYNEVEKAREKR
jgi:hypothetical protein